MRRERRCAYGAGMRPSARREAPRSLALTLRWVLVATLLLAIGTVATAQPDGDALVRSAADRHATELRALSSR